MSLAVTLRGWARRYGPEAAFVGRVAVAALLPPGVNKLVESGLEAAFEYIQSQSERPDDRLQAHEEAHDEALLSHLTRTGLGELQLQQLEALIDRVESDGGRVLSEARAASQAGHSYDEAAQRLRELISSDPTLSAMRASLADITTSLSQLTEQGEVLIAGQAYQTEAIEEMMRMIHAIAQQVGATPHPDQVASAPAQLGLLSMSTQRSALGSALGSPLAPSPSSTSLINDPLFGDLSAGRTQPLERSTDARAQPDALGQLSPTLTPSSSAQALIDRFYHLKGGDRAPPEGSVDLVARFQALIKPNEQGGEDITIGEGRVGLTMTSVGPQPIKVVKWICEAWGLSLADAIIVTQSPPVVIKRSNDFVALAQAQRDLSSLGATLKLSS